MLLIVQEDEVFHGTLENSDRMLRTVLCSMLLNPLSIGFIMLLRESMVFLLTEMQSMKEGCFVGGLEGCHVSLHGLPSF